MNTKKEAVDVAEQRKVIRGIVIVVGKEKFVKERLLKGGRKR